MASEYSPTTSRLFTLASQALSQAANSAGHIGATNKPNLSNPTLNYSPGYINIGSMPKFSDAFTGVDSGNQLIAELNDQVDAWLAKYFPSINGQFQNMPEDWCAMVISGSAPFGTASTVFDMVWQQARDRAGRTVRSEQRQLEATFSSRGFSLPAGALVDALSQSQQRGTAAVLDVVREQAIKDADIKKELLMQAVSIASSLKQGILNTSAEFFKAYYSVHGVNADVARVRAQAYGAWSSALSSYYNLEIAIEDLKLRGGVEAANITLGADRNKVGMYSGDGVAGAFAQASRGFSDIAGSAAAAAGTLVAQIEAV